MGLFDGGGIGDGGGGLGGLGIPGVGGTPMPGGGGVIPNFADILQGGGGGLPGLGQIFGGLGGGLPGIGGMKLPDWSSHKTPATYGTEMKTPTLDPYVNIGALGGAGKLGASTVDASPWMSMALDKQAADQGRLMDTAVQGQQGALAQGRNNLAMKGGLSSGASERMATQGANDLATSRQNVLSQGASDRANLGMQNAQLQTDIGKFNAGQTQGANQFNVSQSIQDLANQNAQNRFQYGEGMKMKGAAMQGQAMENSGKK